jgi:hypothetical protein
MRINSIYIFSIILVLSISCAGGSSSVTPQQDKHNSSAQTVVLATIEVSYDFGSRAGTATEMRASSIEPGSAVDGLIDWSMEFQEYDPCFGHTEGDASEQQFLNYVNPLDKENDGFISSLEVTNTSSSPSVTLYNTRALVAFTENPDLLPWIPRKFLLVNAHDYTTPADGVAADFNDLVPFRYLSTIDPGNPSNDPADHVLPAIGETQAGTQLRIRIVNESQPYYRPVKWVVWIVAEVGSFSGVADRLDTPHETQDRYADVIIAQSSISHTFRVWLYRRVGGTDTPLPQNSYRVVADLTEINAICSNAPLSVALIQDSTGAGWQADLAFNTSLPSWDWNMVLRIPILVYDNPEPGQGTPVIGDVYCVAFQSQQTGTQAKGYYRMSYISRNDDTGYWDMFLMNTFTGETRQLSDSTSGISYNSISESGRDVVWTETGGTNSNRVHVWWETSDYMNQGRNPLPSFPNGFPIHPELSPDGHFIAYQENVDASPDYSQITVARYDEGNATTDPWGAPDLFRADHWDDVAQNGNPVDFNPWFPVVTDPITIYAPGATGPDDIDSGRLTLFLMSGPPGLPGSEYSRVGWFLVPEDPSNTAIIKGAKPYSELYDPQTSGQILAGQQSLARVSLAARPVPGYTMASQPWIPGDPFPGVHHWQCWIRSSDFILTFESDEDGQNLAFMTHFYFESVYRQGKYQNGNDVPGAVDILQRTRFLNYGDTLIGPGTIFQEQHQFFAATNRADDGTILSVLRNGMDRDVTTWLYVHPPTGSDLRVPLGAYLQMGEGEHDIPSISQGDFSFDPDSDPDHDPLPAVAFDSHHFSTGDIYFMRLVHYEPGQEVMVSLKRLTQNGASIWPRLSGWIPAPG